MMWTHNPTHPLSFPSPPSPHPPFHATCNSLGFIVLKLNVEAVLNPDLHLQAVVHLRETAQCVDSNVMFLHNVRDTTYNYNTKEVPVVGDHVTSHDCNA